MTDTHGLVACRRGVRIDTDEGWSAVVAISPDECDRFAASFTAMAAHLRDRPDLVAGWHETDHVERLNIHLSPCAPVEEQT